MSSATPTNDPPRARSTSRSRLPNRPTTPLRPPSRTSLRASASAHKHSNSHSSSAPAAPFPLDVLEPQFAELTDSLADLEANFMHLQLLHESVSRFNENFAAFLYGMNMSAFCVDFPEAPGVEALKRYERRAEDSGPGHGTIPTGTGRKADVDATFLTSDTSFVNDPPASVRTVRHATPTKSRAGSIRGRGRGGIPTRGGSVGSRGGAASRGTGIGRARARGAK
ncbi:hypothetical protein CAC42_1134 [Sphaceloma murrayae]|uniref:DASH complex subunit DAM1 n=1 Tax=Sphaceloma murrayae TaxID=2082308 RepID=A0A2K1R246_9PEZI|nr:hypothetical protein CAC42_1134 [Sphaceloma murrayae]